jgi:hypothetical protein
MGRRRVTYVGCVRQRRQQVSAGDSIMAKREFTEHQQGIIKRYYEHRETIALQNLGEVVSDLYLTAPGTKQKRLWERAQAHLVALEVKESTWRPIIESQNIVRLANLLSELHAKLSRS